MSREPGTRYSVPRRRAPANGDGDGRWSGGELASAAAHQLRGPLTVMRGVLETIARHTDLEPGLEAELIERGLGAAYRQGVLIHTLLADEVGDGAPPRSVERRFVAEEIELRRAVDRVVRESLVPEDQSRIELDVAPGIRVLVDPVALDCVLANLVSNAMNYGPAGTPVVVTADPRDRDVVIGVADGGPGIPHEDRERIFEPYERSSRVAGVGLGLAIARWAAEASNGRIWVEGEPGVGTRFCFTLPLAEAYRRPPARAGNGQKSVA